MAGVGSGGRHVFEVGCMRLCVSGSGGATFVVRFCVIVLFWRRGCAWYDWSVCKVGHLGVVSRCTAFRALRTPENEMFLSVSSMLKSFFCAVILCRTGVWDIYSPGHNLICCTISAALLLLFIACSKRDLRQKTPRLSRLCSALP